MARLGFFLIRIVVWASEQLARTRQRPADYLLAFGARAAVACVTVLGFVVDHLPVVAIFEIDQPRTAGSGTRPGSIRPSVVSSRL